MESAKLTVRLPRDHIRFLKKYSRDHGLSVTRLLEAWIAGLRWQDKEELHPDISQIAGILPQDIDVEDTYFREVIRKHSR